MFKKNPKALAQDAAEKRYSSLGKLTITGCRRSPGECKAMGLPVDSYVVQLWAGGKLVVGAHARNWRTAYKLLKIAIETPADEAVQTALATV